MAYVSMPDWNYEDPLSPDHLNLMQGNIQDNRDFIVSNENRITTNENNIAANATAIQNNTNAINELSKNQYILAAYWE